MIVKSDGFGFVVCCFVKNYYDVDEDNSYIYVN